MHFKKVILSFIGLLVLCLSIFLIFFFSFDKRIENGSERIINTEIKNKDYRALRNQCDKKTFSEITKHKKINIEVLSDNQGAGDVAYYPVKINGKEDYGLFVKFHSMFWTAPQIQKIRQQ